MSYLIWVMAFVKPHVLAIATPGVTTENVTYQDGSASLTGFLAYPSESSGKLPLVMHVHTWSGLSDFEKQRAVRTAAELGYVGFAVSVYTDEETASTSGNNMQAKMAAVTKYRSAPDLFVSRLTAAVNVAKAHSRVNSSAMAAAGYCFGGTAVLQFAKLGGAAASDVLGVLSFHGGLDGLSTGDASFGKTKVLIANGAADTQIPTEDIHAFEAYMTTYAVPWEFSNYASAGHGFTHPSDGSDHFHFDANAEARSWQSMSDFLSSSLKFISSTPAMLPVMTENVSYKDGEANLTGFIAYPSAGSGKLPSVMHVHTWSGLSDFEKNRAFRTAAELGYLGFAVSVYTDEETASTAGNNMQAKIAASSKYGAAPALVLSRLAAAVKVAKGHARVNPSRLAAVGYCFGGTAVLQFAKLGGAAAAGVAAVASFHGGLASVLPASGASQEYCPTRVTVYNGAADAMIPGTDIAKLEAVLEQSKTVWEVTTYANAGHGFTHPTDGSDHFHYEQAAEQRSWTSMASFVDKAWEHQDKAGQLNVSSCGLMQTKDEEMGSTDTTSSCSDDNAAVAAAAGSWGITECRQDLCTGQYADMMKPMCSKTCGLCTTPSTSCDDDNAAVAAAAGSWGITECRQDLCTGQYADMMKPMCKKTCGLCSTPSTACSDDDAAVAAAAGSWGITNCSQDLCTGQYADMMKPMCKKTCGLCDTGDAGGLSLTCGEVKKLYKQSNCCGQPQKPFTPNRRLTDSELNR